MGCIKATIGRIEGITVTIARRDAISAVVGTICDTGPPKPYLDVAPDFVWVYPDIEQYVQVRSNTEWKIE
jgi:hypothetical protein